MCIYCVLRFGCHVQALLLTGYSSYESEKTSTKETYETNFNMKNDAICLSAKLVNFYQTAKRQVLDYRAFYLRRIETT
jgi:hypothetical protein